MTKLHGQIILVTAFSALAAFAMWLGWPWVVGFSLFFAFLVIA